MQLTNHLAKEAKLLIETALRDYDDNYGFGAMSCAAYDTAWVAMVTKKVDGEKLWLFPECFDYLLATQAISGGWVNGSGAQIDGILNTAGPLLAMKRHLSQPLQLQHDPQDLTARIQKATKFLKDELSAWDVSMTDHVGFEIIVPAMLQTLEEEDSSCVFSFESKKRLMKIHDAKMSRFRPEYLYGQRRMTALHSLESFIGKIDFDKVAHHKVNGSMLGSPSSTAAYLNHSSTWNEDSEAYLRHVIKFAAGKESGGVPSAFPSTHFEASWMLSTLLKAHFAPSDLACPALDKMTGILSKSFVAENGALGFAPYFEGDVDDTAKTITSLNMLGRTTSPMSMIEVFEADTHFRTYAGERDPSFTANCNALLALLSQDDVASFSSQILKVTKFLCNYWWHSDGKIKDKWNTCHLYPSLLFVEAMVDVLALLEQEKLGKSIDEDLESRIAITLFQACLRPLLDQKADGSWGCSVEATAYGILILSEARRLCFFEGLEEALEDGIQRAMAFVDQHDENPSYIWIEKVSYASPLLTKSYLLAAQKAAISSAGSSVGSRFWKLAKPKEGMDKHIRLFHQAPLFSNLPEWELRAAMVEASLFLPSLRARRTEVFPRHNLESDDKYFAVIPFFWTSANNRERTYASTSFIHDMTRISMLNFQMDEFIEASTGPVFKGRMDDLRALIRELLADELFIDSAGVTGSENTNGVHDASYNEARDHISRFLQHVLNHPAISSSSAWDKKLLRWELRTYLLAHVQQSDDESRFEQQKKYGRDTSSVSTTTFFDWVRTTSADHISCPYSMRLISCMLGSSLTAGGPQQDCFASAGEKYLATDFCRHLATLCRIYNDLGSAERDLDEGNLNSIEFPEFASHEEVTDKMKELLMLGEYERDCMIKALKKLEKHSVDTASKQGDPEVKRLAKRRMEIWNMFSVQVDLYGQVYVVQDISSRMDFDKGNF